MLAFLDKGRFFKVILFRIRMVIVRIGSVQGYEFVIVAFRAAKVRVLRRVAIAWHERLRS
jgi:hypothetical protein